MAIITGGVLGEFGPAKHAQRALMREVHDYAPRNSPDDWAVDIAFFTGPDMGDASPPVGISPGPVGRTQRRFIVWHRLPVGLSDEATVRRWLVENLIETERLVRDYLPTKNRKCPSDLLADEVASLRESLAAGAS